MGSQASTPPDRPASDLPCDHCPLLVPRNGAFGRTLHHLIKVSSFSAYEISKLSGVNAGNMSKYMNGKRHNPEVETVFQLCAALARSPDIERYHLDQLLRSAGYAPVFAVNDAR